jgi:predicted Zn-dependent peptidase
MRQELTAPDVLLKKIQAVTAEEVQSVARDMFKEEKLNLALIGPVKDTGELAGLLHFG